MFIIDSIGYDYKHEPGFCTNRPNGLPVHAFVFIRSKADIKIMGEDIFNDSPSILIYRKYHEQYFKAHENEMFVSDWFCFGCDNLNENKPEDEIELLLKVLNISFHTLISFENISVISNAVKELENIFYSTSKYKKEIIDLKIKTLFYEIADEVHQEKNTVEYISHHRHELLKIRNKIYELHGPNIPVDEFAKQLNMSSSYFKKIYKQFFNISPGQDIIKSRIEYACNLLHFDNLSVSSISEKCHYSNVEHFIRQFKKYMNCTPSAYRKK